MKPVRDTHSEVILASFVGSYRDKCHTSSL